MKKLYLVTGASGHLGSCIVKELLNRKENVRVLVLPGEEKYIPESVEIVSGNIVDKDTLHDFFKRDDYDYLTLIHCAAIVCIESKLNPMVWKVNVDGCRNVMELALENKVDRVIYVSSVHALEELEYPEIIVESKDFDKDKIRGQYAKSKAEAGKLVLEFADKGLNVSIVHPSGIIGPGDLRNTNNSVNTLRGMYKGTIPVAIDGGYDFVDIRDVVEGILSCEEKGRTGETYLLSNRYITVEEMLKIVKEYKGKNPSCMKIPGVFVDIAAPISEWLSVNVFHSKPMFTPYAISTLRTNCRFSYVKAEKELGYHPRDLKQTVYDTLDDIKQTG